jgi:hypothetical protein
MFNTPPLEHLATHVHAPGIRAHARLAHARGIVEGER